MSKTRGVSLYNKLLKQFTVINNKLPEDRKVSLVDRRKYIKEKIYPQFKGDSAKRVSKANINKSIEAVLNTIVPKEGCNVNYISPSVTADVSWHELDDFIRDVLPSCIFIRIDAGTYGQTKIFNTLNYNYSKNGVKAIVDNIREFVNNESSVDVSFTGNKKLRKGKTNDGTPENYYIDFIIVVNSEPIDDVEPVVFNLPKGEKKNVTSVKNAILARVKDLSNKKKRKKRARKTAVKNIQKIKSINVRQKRSVKPETKKKFALIKDAEYKKMRKQLDRDYNKGLLTDDQYKKFVQDLTVRIFDNRKNGGLI
jgi:hypothetical protein